MNDVESQIESHFNTLPESKVNELKSLHKLILEVNASAQLWFDNGINSEGKVVTNPTIGYGLQTLHYAKGETKEFFQIGICATSTGISIYLIGLKDKNILKETFSASLGKSSITGYCVKYKHLSDLNLEILNTLIQFGFSEKKLRSRNYSQKVREDKKG